MSNPFLKEAEEIRAALDAQLTDTQLALCDVYEMMGGKDRGKGLRRPDQKGS